MTDLEFALVKRRLHGLTGLDLESYKGTQMRRRLESYLARARAASWPELLCRLERDPDALQKVRDFLTINVSNFYRDRKKWDELRDRILPLMPSEGRLLQAWSAGCSNGAEAFSLAMLLGEARGSGRYRVLGSDIDDQSLARCQAGGPYIADDLKELTPAQVARYFRRESGAYWLQAALRTNVTFEKRNLLDLGPASKFDLILCRNVLIYFTEEAKDRVIGGLAENLRPGGILFIGATESISPGRIAGLERVGLSFYRRAC